MASFTSRLCNPTPFPVVFEWAAGIRIRIEPFGDFDLTMSQTDDYRPGKPGSAAVQAVLDTFGIFLLDIDRPYDNQALDALRRSHGAKKSQYDAAHRNLVSSRAAAGVAPDEDALEETLSQMGLVRLRGEINTLARAVKTLEKVVSAADTASTRSQFDPKRTVFVMDNPREFPSVASMNFFLEENPKIAVKHKAFKMQEEGESLGAPSVSTQEFVDDALSEDLGGKVNE